MRISLIVKTKRMDKLEYIPGDFTTWLGRKVRIDGVIVDPDTKQIDYFEIADTGSESVFQGESLKPIKLTGAILKKNGWKKEVMSLGIGNSHRVYTKPDIEEYGYFPIYIEKGIGKEFDVYLFTYNNVCTQIAYIKYVHELQHLLFGLGLNSEMEV